MRRFLVDRIDPEGQKFTITGREAKHIGRVLRMDRGDRFVLMDREGKRFRAVIESVNRSGIETILEHPLPPPPMPPVEIILCQAALKAGAMDNLVEKTSELGVGTIIPFVSERTVVHPVQHKSSGKVRRWREIADSTAKQADRRMPAGIELPCSYRELIERWGGENCPKVILWEREEVSHFKSWLADTAPGDRIVAVVGPEGGFHETEVQKALNAGFAPVSMGRRILRSETAAVALVTLIQYEWGDLGLREP